MLVVLRGDSGSGKSTVAALLQTRLGPTTALLGQDHFRRVVFHEKETDPAHVALLEAAALHSLRSGHHVVIEGILPPAPYAAMLQRVASQTDDARFFAFDLTFEETARRHAERAATVSFTVDEMREWYRGWLPLPFVEEERIGAGSTPVEIVERILS